MAEHKSRIVNGFTKKYNLDQLVWFEVFANTKDAIRAEKKIKRWIRQKKIKMIEKMNPEWKDISTD